jgi:hypothetical protein
VFFGLIAASSQKCGTKAPVAQWIEYCPPKAGVAGSIPAGRAKNSHANQLLAWSSLTIDRSRCQFLLQFPAFKPSLTSTSSFAVQSPLTTPIEVAAP